LVNFYPKSKLKYIKTVVFLSEGPPNLKLIGALRKVNSALIHQILLSKEEEIIGSKLGNHTEIRYIYECSRVTEDGNIYGTNQCE
jgi:hypothetical protein